MGRPSARFVAATRETVSVSRVHNLDRFHDEPGPERRESWHCTDHGRGIFFVQICSFLTEPPTHRERVKALH
jgi:hypothetical protein